MVSIRGLVIAIVVALILDVIGGIAAVPLFAEAMTGGVMLNAEKQTNFFLYGLVVSLFATFVGSYISARYGKLAPYKNSFIFGVISIAFSLIFAKPHPLWYVIPGYITVMLVAILGGHMVARKNT
ncbi:MAG: hypothetical protein CSB48_07050 [Proteobacteria bacterium]|nr:MAG: hypothetical protein CSB48_07050 [Pseudomonadota bacterium]